MTAKMKTSTELYEAESGGKLPRPFDIQSHEDLLQFPDIPVGTIDTPSGRQAISVRC